MEERIFRALRTEAAVVYIQSARIEIPHDANEPWVTEKNVVEGIAEWGRRTKVMMEMEIRVNKRYSQDAISRVVEQFNAKTKQKFHEHQWRDLLIYGVFITNRAVAGGRAHQDKVAEILQTSPLQLFFTDMAKSMPTGIKTLTQLTNMITRFFAVRESVPFSINTVWQVFYIGGVLDDAIIALMHARNREASFRKYLERPSVRFLDIFTRVPQSSSSSSSSGNDDNVEIAAFVRRMRAAAQPWLIGREIYPLPMASILDMAMVISDAQNPSKPSETSILTLDILLSSGWDEAKQALKRMAVPNADRQLSGRFTHELELRLKHPSAKMVVANESTLVYKPGYHVGVAAARVEIPVKRRNVCQDRCIEFIEGLRYLRSYLLEFAQAVGGGCHTGSVPSLPDTHVAWCENQAWSVNSIDNETALMVDLNDTAREKFPSGEISRILQGMLLYIVRISNLMV